jgi:hypothetical protein
MRYLKAVVGACVGLIVSGAWLVGDLMLPEPWGDYLLFGSIALVTAGCGWKIGMFYEKQEQYEAMLKAQKAEIKA